MGDKESLVFSATQTNFSKFLEMNLLNGLLYIYLAKKL